MKLLPAFVLSFISFNQKASAEETLNVVTLHRPRQMGQPNTVLKQEYQAALAANPEHTLTLTLYRDGVDGHNSDPRCRKENIPDREFRFHLQSAFEANVDTPFLLPIENKKISRLFNPELTSVERKTPGLDSRQIQIFLYFCDSSLPAQLRYISFGKLAKRFQLEAQLATERFGGRFKVDSQVKILSWEDEETQTPTYWKEAKDSVV